MIERSVVTSQLHVCLVPAPPRRPYEPCEGLVHLLSVKISQVEIAARKKAKQSRITDFFTSSWQILRHVSFGPVNLIKIKDVQVWHFTILVSQLQECHTWLKCHTWKSYLRFQLWVKIAMWHHGRLNSVISPRCVIRSWCNISESLLCRNEARLSKSHWTGPGGQKADGLQENNP